MMCIDVDEEPAELEVHPDHQAEEDECCNAENDKSEKKGIGGHKASLQLKVKNEKFRGYRPYY